jgi:3,4-dihydroxy-2-butanone 4-phosphate synthase
MHLDDTNGGNERDLVTAADLAIPVSIAVMIRNGSKITPLGMK